MHTHQVIISLSADTHDIIHLNLFIIRLSRYPSFNVVNKTASSSFLQYLALSGWNDGDKLLYLFKRYFESEVYWNNVFVILFNWLALVISSNCYQKLIEWCILVEIMISTCSVLLLFSWDKIRFFLGLEKARTFLVSFLRIEYLPHINFTFMQCYLDPSTKK